MRLGILCPGQGDQSCDMFSGWAYTPDAAQVLDEASAVMGEDLRALVLGPTERLYSNAFAQPLICAMQTALWSALRRLVPTPCVFSGYSVGELAAYACAGSLEVSELITLARQRAEAMDQASSEASTLLALRNLDRTQAAALCEASGVEIAIVNGEDRFVVGGLVRNLVAFRHAAAARGAKVSSLKISVAAHTSIMACASRTFRRALEDSALCAPQVRVLAGIDGSPVFDRTHAIGALARQVSSPIEWLACMQGLVECGCSAVLELGPGSALARMFRERWPQIRCHSISEFRSLEGVARWLFR